ncbi:MAG: hypothetical protein M1833_002069 [Piccolia ochrophora]|nr:MAG: hypothetical protein M1833_002069 [Piccolia ochrophora]
MYPNSHFVPTAADEREAQHLLNRRRLRHLRSGLNVLALILSIAILGCTGHAYQIYNDTSFAARYWLPLWPKDMDIRPTHAMIASSTIIAFMSLSVLAVTFVPTPHSRITLLNHLSALTGVNGLILAVFNVAYNQTASADTIMSWSCRYTYASSESHVNYQRACDETVRFPPLLRILTLLHDSTLSFVQVASFDMMVALIGVETLVLASAALGFWMESRIDKMRRAELGKEVDQVS